MSQKICSWKGKHNCSCLPFENVTSCSSFLLFQSLGGNSLSPQNSFSRSNGTTCQGNCDDKRNSYELFYGANSSYIVSYVEEGKFLLLHLPYFSCGAHAVKGIDVFNGDTISRFAYG